MILHQTVIICHSLRKNIQGFLQRTGLTVKHKQNRIGTAAPDSLRREKAYRLPQQLQRLFKISRHGFHIIILGLTQQKLQLAQTLLPFLSVLQLPNIFPQLPDFLLQPFVFPAQKQPQRINQARFDMLLPDRFRRFAKISHNFIFIIVLKAAAAVFFKNGQHLVIIAGCMIVAKGCQKIVLQLIPLTTAPAQTTPFCIRQFCSQTLQIDFECIMDMVLSSQQLITDKAMSERQIFQQSWRRIIFRYISSLAATKILI